MNIVLITIDSLNRHFLNAYGSSSGIAVQTPNLDAFARKATVFTQHYAGSLPCMPARRELLTGVQEFLWRPWGPLEPFDLPLARVARRAKTITQLITDHYHYFQHGSGGYHDDFHAWEFIRGHEFDAWKIAPREFPENCLAQIAISPVEAARFDFLNRVQYLRNTADFKKEEDFFTPQVLASAINWLDDAREYQKWFLYIDSFEVHEPFYVPEPYVSMYTGEDPTDPYLVKWPHYGYISDGMHPLTERQVAFVRAQYAAKLTMVDRWLGRFLNHIDDSNLWEDTMIIVTTDHGHYLGEHGWIGKPRCPVYNILAHLPLFIWYPGGKRNGQRIDTLTSTVDLYATMYEVLEGTPLLTTHSQSLLPLLAGTSDRIREWVLYGYWGEMVNVTNGTVTYMRAAENPEHTPLFVYSTMLLNAVNPFRPVKMRADMEAGKFLPYVDGPCWRYPRSDQATSDAPVGSMNRDSLLFDTDIDPQQTRNLLGKEPALEAAMADLLRKALTDMQAPEEQFERLGL